MCSTVYVWLLAWYGAWQIWQASAGVCSRLYLQCTSVLLLDHVGGRGGAKGTQSPPWLWGGPHKMPNLRFFPLGSDHGSHEMAKLRSATPPPPWASPDNTAIRDVCTHELLAVGCVVKLLSLLLHHLHIMR